MSIKFNLINFNKIKTAVDCNFQKRATDLTSVAGKNAEPYIKPHIIKDTKESISSLFNGGFSELKKTKEKHKAQRILRGLYSKLSKLESKDGKKLLGQISCESACPKSCGEFTDEILKLLNKNASTGTAKYNTRDVEWTKRLLTGLLPIPFLFNDSFAISKKNGMTDDEATEQAKVKRDQEVISAVGESASQFVFNGAFANFVNNSQYGAPIINTVIGTSFNVFSRLAAGRKLTPLNQEELLKQENSKGLKDINSVEKFQRHIEIKGNLEKQDVNIEGEKAPLFSLKNLAKVILLSVGVGFSFKFGHNKLAKHIEGSTKYIEDNPTKWLAQKHKQVLEKFTKLTTDEVKIDKKQIADFTEELSENVDIERMLILRGELIEQINPDTGKAFIGRAESVISIPHTNIKLTKAQLLQTPLIPFKMVFELVKYPYKIVNKILEQTGVLKPAIELPKMDNDPYNIVNMYKQYDNIATKFKDNPEQISKEFGKFFDDNFNRTFDLERFSSIKNTKTAQLTNTFGMVGSLYFACNDDRNQTLTETGDVAKANKDARTRGMQRFTRIITQMSLIGWFNNVFSRHYNASLIGALGVTAACTVATDKVTRLIMGQPTKKMSNDELQEFEEKKKTGNAGWYYKFIDKLSS